MVNAEQITRSEMDADLVSDQPEGLRHWLAAQQTLASSTNLALLTVGPDNNIKKDVANETSICQSFLNDPTKARMCAEFCGRARQRAIAENRTITYRCGANLHCFAAPLKTSDETSQRAVIGGRTFLSATEYREFLQREKISGSYPDPKLFSNIKFTDEEEFERARQMILTTANEILSHDFGAVVTEPLVKVSVVQTESSPHPPAFSPEQLETFFNGSFDQGCREAMRLIGSRFKLRSAALLMRTGKRMSACAAGGEQREQLIGLSLNLESVLLNRLYSQESKTNPVPLTAAEMAEIQTKVSCNQADIFPLFIGEELTGILLILDTDFNEQANLQIARLGQNLIVPLELARLRSEVSDRTKSLAQWQDFAHLLATRANAPETYSAIVEKVATTLNANRVSLLIYNEESKKLICKAATGLNHEVVSGPKIGEGIAGVVLERGEPLLVRDLREQAWVASRTHGQARSNSFISFPLLSGSKRLGVINLTDRVDDQSFVGGDLDWLNLFQPYVAAALERIDLREKAQRFQLLAITDPLTGLLNRRYLEERFSQEIERSKRYQFPLSFVMMDIDGFKTFNDTFGHQAGDEVLRETAHCIRKSLRNFDVAARYGGEEFIVVLPETDVTSAMILAERLRKAVANHFASENSKHPVTISLGVSSLSKTLQNRHQVIRAADQALYAAKKRGKNCVVVYNTELVPGLT